MMCVISVILASVAIIIAWCGLFFTEVKVSFVALAL